MVDCKHVMGVTEQLSRAWRWFLDPSVRPTAVRIAPAAPVAAGVRLGTNFLKEANADCRHLVSFRVSNQSDYSGKVGVGWGRPVTMWQVNFLRKLLLLEPVAPSGWLREMLSRVTLCQFRKLRVTLKPCAHVPRGYILRKRIFCSPNTATSHA